MIAGVYAKPYSGDENELSLFEIPRCEKERIRFELRPIVIRWPTFWSMFARRDWRRAPVFRPMPASCLSEPDA